VSEGHPAAELGGGAAPTAYPETSADMTPETLYERLAGYGFVRRYAEGKVVADFGRESLGHGAHLLSQVAKRVTGLTDFREVADLASRVHPAANVEYRGYEPPVVPYPDGHFDVVVALGNEGPTEAFVTEAKRILKRDGMLIVSTLDRRVLLETVPESDGRLKGAYVPEFRAFLGGHFEHVRLFRLGAAAGGLVFPEDGWGAGFSPENVPSSTDFPLVDAEPPATRSALAVCSLTETPAQEELPYLVLDRDRRLFEECGDRAEAVELLRGEITRMQETEVQAFQDTYKLLYSEIAVIRAQLRRSEARARQVENRAKAAEDRVREMENSATWRIFEPYRQLRIRLYEMRKGTRDK
jgi:SAM-dependent methyltransferase